ncbi:MAG: MFS transporter [Rhizobiales bacterium]|nr:MFS transporter [Hyphomicrobiales bacterium]
MTDASQSRAPAVRVKSRVALSLSFLAGGCGFGAWGASLPSLSRELGLSEGQLGLVLLCFALGGIVTMLNVPRLVGRFGGWHFSALTAGLFGAMVAVVGTAQEMIGLALIAAAAGAASGALDVRMNSEAAELESHAGKPIMSSLHAMFSFGGLAAGAACGQLLRHGVTVDTCLAVSGAAVVAMAVIGARLAPARLGPREEAGSRQARERTEGTVRSGGIWLLGLLAFLGLFAEGAILDWAGIYLVRNLGAPESLGAFAFAVLAGTMAVGRAAGDFVTHAFGPGRLVRAGALLVAVSLAAVLSMNGLPLIFVALGLTGLGLANIVPLIFSAAGRLAGDANGSSMSRVMTMGYAGILVGPPFIGFVAESTSLVVSLCVVAAAAVVIAALGRPAMAR